MHAVRRFFWCVGTWAVAAGGLACAVTAAEKAPPAYKIIYNWDGAPHGYSEYPQSLEQFLQKTFAPLKDTQAGALFFCVGEHEATWDSKTLQVVGDSKERRYESVNAMRHSENIRAMLDRGENPYQAMVERGKELGIDVYVSIRMNDNHFQGLQPDEMPKTTMIGLARFRKDHPEWCLGPERTPEWFALSWNMAIPEVREHRFRYIREALEQADWDGIELDWQRHGFHLPRDEGPRLSYTLTDLQRAVRQVTEEIARKRGRPFPVAVRVATTLESCRRIGYDLETWIREGLCDIIIAGGGAGTDPGAEVESFLKLVEGTSIRFYAGFDSGFWGGYEGLRPRQEWERALFRGYSKSFWERGVHGIYAFNWHANEKTRRDLLTTVGSVETLRGTDKVYEALHRHVLEGSGLGGGGSWVGADLNDRIHGTTPVALYRTLTDSGPRFVVAVHDDVVSEHAAGRLDSVELHVELFRFAPGDRVEVKLDGRVLRDTAVRSPQGEDPQFPGDAGENSWLVWSLEPREANRGSHEVQVRVLDRNPRMKTPLIVRRVEIHVDYK